MNAVTLDDLDAESRVLRRVRSFLARRAKHHMRHFECALAYECDAIWDALGEGIPDFDEDE